MKKKINTRYPVIEYLGTCTHCGETNLAEQFGDTIIDGKPVCAFCQRNPRPTERSEGGRTSEQSERVSEHHNA